MAVLKNLKQEEELAKLRKELEEAKAAAEKARSGTSIRFEVGAKGGMSVYGLGRFPVTLYYEQWLRLLEESANIRSFLAANKARMKLKE